MGTRVLIQLEMPEQRSQSPEKAEAHRMPTVEEKVREAIDLVDSGYCSHTEWLMLNKLYESLCRNKKQGPRIQNLKKMIEPVLAKYGYHKVSTED